MKENRLTRLHIDGKSVVFIGGMAVKNQIIGMVSDGWLLTTECLIPLFNRFSSCVDEKGKESIITFLKGEYVFKRPICDITPFSNDPSTGEKIDWAHIREAVEKELKNPTRDWNIL